MRLPSLARIVQEIENYSPSSSTQLSKLGAKLELKMMNIKTHDYISPQQAQLYFRGNSLLKQLYERQPKHLIYQPTYYHYFKPDKKPSKKRSH